MAYPSVITPRTMGQAIHLCFSEGRASGSLMVTTSPDGLRQAMAQACGERIITPSSTACPPTRVSSPLSRAGSNWTAAKKRKFCRQRRIVIGCCFEEGRLQVRRLDYHRIQEITRIIRSARRRVSPYISVDCPEMSVWHPEPPTAAIAVIGHSIE